MKNSPLRKIGKTTKALSLLVLYSILYLVV